MGALTKTNLDARRFLTSEFSTSFPKSFRCLQDMAVAGSKAYLNNGRRAWFGLGRDLTIESMQFFTQTVALLVYALHEEEFINLPAAKGMTEIDQVNRVVSLFFTAYPNWPDAEGAWTVVAPDTVTSILERLGYVGNAVSVITVCPQCSQRLRFPKGRTLDVTCPTCRTTFRA